MLSSTQQRMEDQIKTMATRNETMMASLQKQMEEMEQRLTITQRPTDPGN